MYDKKKLVKSLCLRIVMFILVGALACTISYYLCPTYSEEDIYEIKGTCVDIYLEKAYFSKPRFTKKYICMDNGEKYRLHTKIIDHIDDLENLKNQEILFYVSDKSLSIDNDTFVVAWGDAKDETLAAVNKVNQINTVSTIPFIFLFDFAVFLLEPILRISAYRDAQKEKQWHIQKKETRHKKIIDKNLPPLEEQKTKPKNISKKKWERRKKL